MSQAVRKAIIPAAGLGTRFTIYKREKYIIRYKANF